MTLHVAASLPEPREKSVCVFSHRRSQQGSVHDVVHPPIIRCTATVEKGSFVAAITHATARRMTTVEVLWVASSAFCLCLGSERLQRLGVCY